MLKIFGLTAVAMLGGACGAEDPEAGCDQPGVACTWAGTGVRGIDKVPSIHRMSAKLDFPEDITFGPDGQGYIVDWNSHMVRRVDLDGQITVAVGTDYEGDGAPQSADMLPRCAPFGATGTTVAMNHPTDVEFGPDGKLYIAAWHNNKIRVWDPATNHTSVLAGDGYGYSVDGTEACRTLFNQPKALAITTDGTLYTIDQRNVRIRAMSLDVTQPVRTIAGTGAVGDGGDGGLAMEAQFGFETGTTPRPTGALVLHDGDLLVADSANNRIRRIDLETNVISAIAGKLEAGYSGDGGSALEAQMNFPMDMELGPDGRLYVADRYNNVVRAIDLGTGIIETVVGSGESCSANRGDCPDTAAALAMPLQEPYGVGFDADGNLYVADTHNSRILKVTR